MLKVAFYPAGSEAGPPAIPLFNRKTDAFFEKTAAPQLLPSVSSYINALKPQKGSLYTLVSALGSGEYWSSNSNGDHFEESGLIHAPTEWTGNPVVDRVRSKGWPYGFPTFYEAGVFVHHRNQDRTKAIGEVELSAWNPEMHRVELVIRLDERLCDLFGGRPVWDRINQGEFPDLSMGARVCYDLCSLHLDKKLYQKALDTFDPKKFRYPGEAAAAYHKKLIAETGKGIPGLAITRKEYCPETLKHMNVILPDGRKIWVRNPYPRFFDISFVFIGADKTAKMMLKLGSEGVIERTAFWFLPGAELAEKLGYSEKTAAKEAEITKRVTTIPDAVKAVPVLTGCEPDIPNHVLDQMAVDPGPATATAALLGICIRPREFQRIILIHLGERNLADSLDSIGSVFPPGCGESKFEMQGSFSKAIFDLLAPLFAARSALGPAIERRALLAADSPKAKTAATPSLPGDLLRKIGAAYNGYRLGLLDMISNVPAHLPTFASGDLVKVGTAPVEDLFTPLTAAYLDSAYYNELGGAPSGEGALPPVTP